MAHDSGDATMNIYSDMHWFLELIRKSCHSCLRYNSVTGAKSAITLHVGHVTSSGSMPEPNCDILLGRYGDNWLSSAQIKELLSSKSFFYPRSYWIIRSNDRSLTSDAECQREY